ncbi:hypothetical protein, partial [Pectobacterium versatile]|uniref:hypothetical protein n=1 Tax=Pectobacterium versatile TaxID=2488639 RepID=UPI001B366509
HPWRKRFTLLFRYSRSRSENRFVNGLMPRSYLFTGAFFCYAEYKQYPIGYFKDKKMLMK